MNELKKEFQIETGYDVNCILIGERDKEYIKWLENKIENLIKLR
jgi:hypothetical protein